MKKKSIIMAIIMLTTTLLASFSTFVISVQAKNSEQLEKYIVMQLKRTR